MCSLNPVVCIHVKSYVTLFLGIIDDLEFYLRTNKSLSWGVDESQIWTHLGLCYDSISVLKFQVHAIH